MENKFVLYPLQMKDCEAVFEIARESLPEHWSLSGVQDVLKYDNNIYYVARCMETDEIVGFAGIMIVADEAELLNIAVKAPVRDKGIGELLLTQVIWSAKERNAVRMLLEVRESNEKAIHLYKKKLFTVLGKRKAYYSNPTEDAVIMERKLGML